MIALTTLRDTLVRAVLNDQGSTPRWTDALLDACFLDALRWIAKLRPDALAQTITHALEPGARQSIPSSAARLLDAKENVDGRRVRVVSLQLMNNALAYGSRPRPARFVSDVTWDRVNPQDFYVYPPAASGAALRLVVSMKAEIVEEGGVDYLPVSDRYAPIIVDYALGRAYQIDSGEGSMQRSRIYLQSAYQAMNMKFEAEQVADPVEGM